MSVVKPVLQCVEDCGNQNDLRLKKSLLQLQNVWFISSFV